MNRLAIQAARGRAAPTHAQSLGTTTTHSSTTPKTAAAAFFSTTASRAASDDRPAPQSAAVDKLARLSRRLNNKNTTSSSNNSYPPAGQRQALDPVPGVLPRAGRGGIDARSLRVSPDAAGAGGASSSFSPSSSAPRVLNLRSLRGGLRSSRMPFGSGLRGAEGGGFGRPRFGAGVGGLRGGGGGLGGGRFGGAGGGGRFGGGGIGARGRGGRGRRGGGGARLRRRRGDNDDSAQSGSGRDGKLTWSEGEQAVIDRLEKGEVVPFEPKLTLDSLSGYGAAMATDAPLGQVETALRTMRLMTGGMAFNADSGVTTDLNEIMKRYCAKKPFFVHSKGEKEWIESSNPKLQIVGPNAETKKAIINTAVLGKYEAPGFAELRDVKTTMASYHARTFTYKESDSQKFMDKVLSLLPAQQGGGQPAAQAKK